jgi:hypothetical protein
MRRPGVCKYLTAGSEHLGHSLSSRPAGGGWRRCAEAQVAHGTEGLRGEPADEAERVQLMPAVQHACLVGSGRLRLLRLFVGRSRRMHVLEANGAAHLFGRGCSPARLLSRPLLVWARSCRSAGCGPPASTHELEAFE